MEIVDRPVLVQAGPGTGKTRTLTHRIAGLIQDGGVHPGKITAVTFTRKAAAEMRQRLEGLAPPQSVQGCWVGTFHQLGARILDMFADKAGIETRDKVLDEDEALSLFRQAVRSANLGLAPAQVPSLFREVSLLKQNLVDCLNQGGEPMVGQAYVAYEEHLKSAGAFDLDDLLVRPVRLLEDHPAMAGEISATIAEHLLVDEFQDVNKAQYQLVRLLASPRGQGLFVIGDPDQAIYGFRGSDRRFFQQFTQDYPSAQQVRLGRNYRSLAPILKAAAEVLDGRGTENTLSAERSGAKPVRIIRLPSASAEGEFIVRAIDAALGGASFFSLDSRDIVGPERDLGFRDFAVLFRLNAVGDSLEEAFESSGIPYQRARRTSPSEEAEALDPRGSRYSDDHSCVQGLGVSRGFYSRVRRGHNPVQSPG